MTEIMLSLLTFDEGRGRSQCVKQDQDNCNKFQCYESAEHIRRAIDSSAGLLGKEKLLSAVQVSAHVGNILCLEFLPEPQSRLPSYLSGHHGVDGQTGCPRRRQLGLNK